MNGVIVLRHIKVENANAIAGVTWGFPAIANFLGFTRALQRQFEAKSAKPKLTLAGCGIVCHQHQAQAYKTHEYGDYCFALTRNPLDKAGKSSAFVEEGRMHMDVSLVIPFDGRVRTNSKKEVEAELKQLAIRQRLAGGTIIDIKKVEIWNLDGDPDADSQSIKRIMRSLLPGFALVSRKDTLAEHQQHRKEQASPLADYDCNETDLQAWLEFSSLAAKPQTVEEQVKWSWEPNFYSGWLRPIATGYKAISALYQPGEVLNARDSETPVRFVETLYSLGEWLSPHRIKTIEQLYWYYQQDESQGFYQCTNNDAAPQKIATTSE
jgi:CRISPR-associated protein Csy2